MLRFAGFELNQQRAELRGPGGESIRLRPKPFAMLNVLAANTGRIVSKQELMEAVWPNIHVGEDSLFQCIREIRTALGDDQRRLIKVVSGRGYLFEAEVSNGQAAPAEPTPDAEDRYHEAEVGTATGPGTPVRLANGRPLPLGLHGRMAVLAVAGLCLVVAFAAAASFLSSGKTFTRHSPAIAVMPIVAEGDDRQGDAMASGVTDRLIDGLAKIDNIRVVVPPTSTAPDSELASGFPGQSEFVLQGELQKEQRSWTLQARLIKTATGEVQSVATVSVGADHLGVQLQQTRLAAGAGHQFATSINTLLEAHAEPVALGGGSPPGSGKVVIEQAIASINQTTRERFATAQSMLEKALAGEPDDVDLQVALAALQTRGIQLTWYGPDERAAAEISARSLLERALRVRPRSIPVLEAYCRFLTATNNFAESLVACARALSFDPWNGSALYQLGLTQIQLGRFEDALAIFRQADQFDTPEVSRWTWLLGAGWASLLMDRDEDAVAWLQRSIAITPASGRPYLLLAVAYQRVGRTEEAQAVLAKGMMLRPDTTALNVMPPIRNASAVYVEAGRRLVGTMVDVGLPER